MARSRTNGRGWLAISATAAALMTMTATAHAQAPTARVGDAPPAQLAGAQPLGAASDATRLALVVVLAPRDPAALDRFVADVSTPGSPSYRHHLTKGAFRSRFGPTDATLDATLDALRDAGLAPGTPSGSGLIIPVTATVGQAEDAFDTSIRAYRLPDGERAVANVSAPALPAAVADDVEAVVGLDTRTAPKPALVTPRGRGSRATARGGRARSRLASPYHALPCTDAQTAADAQGGLNYDDFSYAYDFWPLYEGGLTGAGATVALLELEPHTPADIATFQACYGTSTNVQEIPIGAGPSGPQSGEAALDIETVVGLAPEADVLVYSAPATYPGWIQAYQAIADEDRAAVVSTSWGGCESEQDPGLLAAERTVLAQMAAQGQSFVSAAGDSGSAACAQDVVPPPPIPTQLSVQDPASQPYATGVGGTQLVTLTIPPSETVWNMGGSGGGGGISTLQTMPWWQAGPGVISGHTSSAPCGASGVACRQVPDVSAAASGDGGYTIYFGGSWGVYDGTSAATPLWGSLITLANTTPSCAGRRLGFLNPALYSLAAHGAGVLSDITIGDNDAIGANGGLYPATPGYDMASGLGTPIGTPLAAALCSSGAPVFTSAPGAGFTAGQAGSFTVTVAGSPTPQLSVIGALPAGLAFADNGDGTGTLSGTPTAAGSTTVTLAATNGLPPAASQAFTIAVAAPGAAPPAAPPPGAASGAPIPSPLTPSAPTPGSSVTVNLATRTPTLGRARTLALPFACPRVIGGCTFTATLTTTVRGHRIALGRVPTTKLAAGRAATRTIHVSRATYRRLKRAGVRRARVRVAIATRFADGRRATRTTTIVVRVR